MKKSRSGALHDFFSRHDFNFVISNPREPDNPIIYASDGFYEMTGYKPKEILNKNCRILQGSGTSKQAVAEIRDAIREERPCSVVLLNYRKDKTPFWNAFTLSPVRGSSSPDAPVQFYIGIQADVTRLVDTAHDKEAIRTINQDNVHHALQLGSKLLDNAAINQELHAQCKYPCATDDSVPSSLVSALGGFMGAFVLTNPNLPDNPMVFCSPGFLRLTGYSCDELIGKNCRLLQGEDTNGASVERIREGLKKEQAFTVVLTNYKKDGTPFNNCLHVAPVRDASGALVFFCGVQVELGEGDEEEGRKKKKRVVAAAAGEGVVGGREEEGKSNATSTLREPTPMQLLEQKGTVAAVKVAARALAPAAGGKGLRRASEDQVIVGSGGGAGAGGRE